jgi:serine/threonine protein kinase/Tol biopolymer transport system component
MSLTAGTRLGSYEVLAPIGAGGMGEVYRARDAKLGREVAIKVLPEAFAHDPDRLSRFQREAKMLASLNHPNIATIHGLEQSRGTSYLVMELVSGDTLVERVKAGALGIEEALKIAVQIAEALEAAHEKSIIHRDLKPANVKVTPEGKVKVLDFGLAKAYAGDAETYDPTNSPTLSAAATMQGMILGTAAYMSPEQARGKSVDKRTDIWAFGCVLYELLTGKQTFHGEDVTDILAAVVKSEPDWTALPAKIPSTIRTLLSRCLRKDRRQRIPDAGAVRIEIEDWIAAPKDSGATQAAPATRVWSDRLAWPAAAVAFALIAIGLAAVLVLRPPKPLQPVQAVRLSADIGADAGLYTAYGPSAILSPDGTRLALVASGADHKQRLYIRSLDQLQATTLSGTENARNPFFSPDGQWIGFFADGKLKKTSVQGGAAVTLCDAPNDRGGSWGGDGTIVFTPDNLGSLSKVSSAGGAPQPLISLDKQAGEISQRWPQVLPGGTAVLFTSNKNGNDFEDAEIVVYSMSSGQRKTVQSSGYYARYLPSGHVVYMHESTLFAVPFDLKQVAVTGQPAPILDGMVTNPSRGAAQISFSETGDLVYVAGRSGGRNVSIYWMDHVGKFTSLRGTPGDYYNPAFSPDGNRLALEISDSRRRDIWVYEGGHDTLTRLTFAGETNTNPVWTPDGQRIAYSSKENGGAYGLWWIRADGAGDAQRLANWKSPQFPASWQPDGKVLAFSQLMPDASLDIMTLSIEGNEKSGWKPGEPRPFLSTPFTEGTPAFSPDGRWLAYRSDESGNNEVYVRPFPGPGGKWQISTGGGLFPKWSHNGKELFYRATTDGKIMEVTYTVFADSFHADKPQIWSPGQFNDLGAISTFDLHPDGKRFAVLKTPGTDQTASLNKVSFIFNFFDELRSKFPSGTK